MLSEPAPYRRADMPIEQRIADLLERMSLDEKIDQLHQSGVGDTTPNNLPLRADEFRPTYGSYILNGPADVALRNELQRRALTESRLGIPAIFGADVIHGYRLIFPIPLAQACSWNVDLVRRACEVSATMARAQGVDWTFAPMVDHCVDPRWGRIAETFGESPFASSVFAEASVNGYQKGPNPIAACLKHYVGYGASEGGRDYSYTEIAPQALWEMHLPPFEAGIRAGARSVMSAFNDLNGVPTSANRYTLTEILRDRWGFRGVVVSDWNSVWQLIQQGAAADEAEAAEKAILAGVDLDMADGLYRKHLTELVATGRVSAAVVDEAVRRVLRVKFELGLFENPLVDPELLKDAGAHADSMALAEELAGRSIVLLKNNGVLPLSGRQSGGEARRIALIGPLAENRGALLGSWAQQGRPEETPTIAEALRERLPSALALHVEKGCSVEGNDPASFEAALTLARESDVVILCLGEEQTMSGENASRSTLRFAGRQEELARAIAAQGKPVILVIVSGRPLELHAIEQEMHAIITAWQGGSRAAAAITDVLLGRRNPSGKLAITWPRTTGQIPMYHQMRPRARTGDQGAYHDIETTPLYEFGHGLSYTSFAYSRIRLARSTVRTNETLAAEITVTNTGDRDGEETLFWFIRDPAARITRPWRELKYFEQAAVPKGGSHVFHFEIDPRRDLSFPDENGTRVLEVGKILLFAGPETAEFIVTA